MMPAQRPVTCKDVKAFEEHCVRLRACWVHYQTLFEGSDLRRELLKTTAETFFGDLNLMLIEHLILQVSKLTDPEGTGQRRNLTVEFLANNSDFPASANQHRKLTKLAARMHEFRDCILPARNKLISHLDLDAAHGRESLGGAPLEAWQRFWRDLTTFVRIIHERYFGEPFSPDEVGRLSDAYQLVKAMKESTCFRTLLDDGTLTLKVHDVARHSKYYTA
jgi:hypothetical protein